jgi:diguanylate cyclase (GGDEF)-like protein
MATSEQQPNTPATLRVVAPAIDENTARRVASERRLALRLRLGTLLHATLDLGDLIQQFGREVARELSGAGLQYQPAALDEVMHCGHSGSHRVTYQLEYDNLPLGTLECSRDKRFSERELEKLELMIGCLIPALRNAMRYQTALQSAVLDPMTGLGNRIALTQAIEREIALGRRHPHPASLLVIDIDHFKQINDTCGHSGGDAVLLEVARTLRRCCRETDALFRFGGEEFVALLTQTDDAGAEIIAGRIRDTLAQTATTFQERQIAVTVSIGVARVHASDTMLSWFDRADSALYRAKESGRNRVVVADAPRPTTGAAAAQQVPPQTASAKGFAQ